MNQQQILFPWEVSPGYDILQTNKLFSMNLI